MFKHPFWVYMCASACVCVCVTLQFANCSRQVAKWVTDVQFSVCFAITSNQQNSKKKNNIINGLVFDGDDGAYLTSQN